MKYQVQLGTYRSASLTVAEAMTGPTWIRGKVAHGMSPEGAVEAMRRRLAGAFPKHTFEFDVFDATPYRRKV